MKAEVKLDSGSVRVVGVHLPAPLDETFGNCIGI